MTAEQQTFTQKFKPPPSKVDKTSKIALRHFQGRGTSMEKNGDRRGDVTSQVRHIEEVSDEFPERPRPSRAADGVKMQSHGQFEKPD
jgi:hypothetical protein